MTEPRTATAVDARADRHLDEAAAHDPLAATFWGVTGHDHELPELSPDWYAEGSALRRRALADLAALEPLDATDRITITALREELELGEELRATGADEAELNVLDSPLQRVRDIFDITPTTTVDDWSVVVRRLAAVPASIAGYTESLRFAARAGHVAPRRQVERGIEQCGDNTGRDGFFAGFARDARPAEGELPEPLQRELTAAAQAAADAYDALRSYLAEELLPQAGTQDACGRELYALHSRRFVGARVDLEETYAWGQEELARVVAEMGETAARVRPGATVDEAIDLLDHDESRIIEGAEAFRDWMQRTADEAVADLAGSHFDIPDAIRTLECRIAPTQLGGIYYTGPSEDLVTRPGRMWWSVPKGDTQFATWRERTTVYHEGVPGHHLQIGQTAYRAGRLNRWRRIASWISGHGEGWALYAERLMGELGYLDDPGDYLGQLDAQSLRAARVVIDIGVHCGFEAPAEVGGGAWDYDKAWRFLSAHALGSEGYRRFELDRYLGWPGQAPSYKIGERMWLQLRSEVAERDGSAFDLRTFHRRALDIGSVGLDLLRAAVLDEV